MTQPITQPITLADLDGMIALRRKLAKLDKKRGKLLRALAALGVVGIDETRDNPRAKTAAAGDTAGRRPAAPIVVAVLSDEAIRDRALRAVLSPAVVDDWRKGNITDEDFEERIARRAEDIRTAEAEIRAGATAGAAPEPCTICDAPSTLIVMGEPFCTEHRPRPVQIAAAS